MKSVDRNNTTLVWAIHVKTRCDRAQNMKIYLKLSCFSHVFVHKMFFIFTYVCRRAKSMCVKKLGYYSIKQVKIWQECTVV